MKPLIHWNWAYSLLHLGLLRTASLIVPSPQRAEWRREWRGELWHVKQVCAPENTVSGQPSPDVTRFCLGAFQDALCMRRAGRQSASPLLRLQGSPTQCLLILAAMLAAAYAVALWLPGVRAERTLWSHGRPNPHAVLIQKGSSESDAEPTILPSEFRSWASRRQTYFDGFAFYRVALVSTSRQLLPREPQGNAHWNVAHASSNLFTLLGLPVQFADAGTGDGLSEVVLSERIWKTDFGADPHIAGMIMHLGPQTVRIGGVVTDGSLGLPGKADAWLLQPDADRETDGAGFVVAHLTPAGVAEKWAPSVYIAAYGPHDTEQDLRGVFLDDLRPDLRALYLFALMLALLALPAITSVSLGEYSLNPHKTSWSQRLARWAFLCAKMALLMPIVYFISLDLAYGCTTLTPENGAYIQLAVTFGLCLFGLRWVLKDQRQRCPVCIRRVTHPAQVGQASRTFLDWNGTEMMCMGGHTLLHVPSLPTSWFSSQRWLYLDHSWNFLFAGSTQPLP